jgi:hypothetical protein
MRWWLPLVVMAVAVAACGSSSKGASSTTTASTAPAASTTTSTLQATTTTIAMTPQGSPDAASNALIDAWHKGDRAAALRVALPAAVDAMFAQPVQATSDRGCQDPQGGSSSCAFGYGSGLLSLQLTMVSGGWVVQAATFE